MPKERFAAEGAPACRGPAPNVITPQPEEYHAERRARLRERLDREAEVHPPAWRAEQPGDEFLGVFEGWRKGTTARDETHTIAILREPETGDPVAVWCFYTVLRAEFEKAAPEPGELVAVRRLPDREGPNGKYRVYRVVVDRDDQDEPPAKVTSPVDEGVAK